MVPLVAAVVEERSKVQSHEHVVVNRSLEKEGAAEQNLDLELEEV